MGQALIDRIRAGDEDAVTELVAAYSGRIHWIAFRYLHNHEDAEEIVQDVLLTVVRKAAAFRGAAALSTWIYRIAFNATMTRVRRARPEQQAASLADVRALEIVDTAARPDARVYRSQLRRKLRRAILALPAAYRAPVVLRDLRGLSTAQAGAVLAINEGTLKSAPPSGPPDASPSTVEFLHGGVTTTRSHDAVERGLLTTWRALQTCR